jgi:hypothetical protein
LENLPFLHLPTVKKADFAPEIQEQDSACMLSKRTGCIIHLLGVGRVPTRALLLRVPNL